MVAIVIVAVSAVTVNGVTCNSGSVMTSTLIAPVDTELICGTTATLLATVLPIMADADNNATMDPGRTPVRG